MPQWIRSESEKGFAPRANLGQPPAEDCPKCLRRWSTATGDSNVGCLDRPSPDDEVGLDDLDYLDAPEDDEFVTAGAAKWASDAGMSTVEYAVGTVVAAAFAAVLYKIVIGDSVIAGLTNLINTALSTTF